MGRFIGKIIEWIFIGIACVCLPFAMFLLTLSACKTDTGGLVVVSERFICNRVNAHCYISIEKYDSSGCMRDSIDEWFNHIVNDHLCWVYNAEPTTGLRYDSKDFASQYRKYAYRSAIQYDKDLSAGANDVGEGEASQRDSLKIYKTCETFHSISYSVEEYFCWGHTHPTRYKINVVFDNETGRLIKNEFLEIS